MREGREKNSQPLRTERRHPLANLPRCTTPGQSEAAHTIFQHRVAGQSNHGAQVPSRPGGSGWRRRRLPQTGEVMMRSREDSEERRRIGREWACGRHLHSPPSHLVSSSEGASGRNRRRSLANGQHDARLSRPGAVSGRGKEAQGFFGVVQKCIFQSRGLKISDLDEWRSPKRCDPERPPSCRGWLVASSLGQPRQVVGIRGSWNPETTAAPIPRVPVYFGCLGESSL